jgi:uncharacterized protein (UPF0276 family)
MLFSLNYSPEMADLIMSGHIHVDRIKCAEWPDMIAAALPVAPVYVHFRLMAGQELLSNELLDSVSSMREETNTPFINTHIAPRFQDYADPADKQAVINGIRASLEQLADRFGAENVIAENIPYPEHNPGDKPFLSADPQVITRAVEETGVGLLLDLGHARRTAEYLAIDPRRYISELPVSRLRELHVTGLGYNEKGERVDHLPMRDEDWDLLQWALDNIRDGHWSEPWSVSCEYGGIGQAFRWRSKREVIAVEAPRMVEMIRAAQPVRA